MRLEWIDDILAVLDSGSLVRAAERRFLTQSAFTRRIRTIEQTLGTELFDRRRKPLTLMPGVAALEPELRDLSTRLRRLRHGLKTAASQTKRRRSFACQHAITTTVSPEIVKALTATGHSSVRVRSGNQDECALMLLSGEVEFAVMYTLPDDRSPFLQQAFESMLLATDMLIPVCTPAVGEAATGPEIAAITYPGDVFLGQVFDRTIATQLPEGMTVTSRAETALTLAMLQYVLSGIGFAWLPLSLVAAPLAQGLLVRKDDRLPTQSLEIRMLRLSEGQTEQGDALWRDLKDRLDLPLRL